MAKFYRAKWELLEDYIQGKINELSLCPTGSVGEGKKEIYEKIQRKMEHL